MRKLIILIVEFLGLGLKAPAIVEVDVVLDAPRIL